MRSTIFSAGARGLFLTSIIARLPLAMLSVGLVVDAQHLTGSFAAAGLVTGIYAAGLSVGGPLLGQLVDRRGQTAVLVTSAAFAAALLVTLGALPTGAPLLVIVALAAGVGVATPPIAACLRMQLPALLSDPAQLSRAYAFEASVVELTWVLGPPLVLCVDALWSIGAALAVGGVVLLLGTIGFTLQPASRSWRPATSQRRPRGGSLRTPEMRTLVIVLSAVGVLLGADEVAVTAAAKALDGTTAAAPLFAVWGVGSFAGGLLLARRSNRAGTGTGLALLLAALTVTHLALIPVAGSMLGLGAVLLLAGASISPTEAAVYAMVDGAAPAGTLTEAFAWLDTAMSAGGAIGAAGAGVLIAWGGANPAFAFAGAAGAVALVTSALRSPARHSTPPIPSPLATNPPHREDTPTHEHKPTHRSDHHEPLAARSVPVTHRVPRAALLGSREGARPLRALRRLARDPSARPRPAGTHDRRRQRQDRHR
jgi:MFS family permease